MAQDLHEEPSGVAARPLRPLQRLVGQLHAGLHPHEIADLALQLLVEPDQHVDRLLPGPDRRPEAVEPRREQGTGRFRFQERNEFLRQRRRVGVGIELGVGLDEEMNGLTTVMSAVTSTTISSFWAGAVNTSRATQLP